MPNFPNLEALVNGRISGKVSEWPILRQEARDILALVQAPAALPPALASRKTILSSELRFTNFRTAGWHGQGGLTYSLIALSTEGILYRYDNACDGWLPYSMKKADCAATVGQHAKRKEG